ncbi:MAG: PDDEXK nuclease domain-containing protein [Planctomycetota bacterium]|jgi:predicted nuclease of restriction endonuclease-like (RecB) superfamily
MEDLPIRAVTDKAYLSWLVELKERLKSAQLKAALAVNSEMIEFYWELAADIVEKQRTEAWGSGLLKQLSRDLMKSFPGVKGLSVSNLQYARRWYLFYSQGVTKIGTACSDFAKPPLSQLAQIPWGHNIRIVSKCDSVDEALFYVRKTVEHGWSRAVLIHQIDSRLFEREGRAVTNFDTTLPSPHADLAREMLKNPYSFDFLDLTTEHDERELETALVDRVTRFLLELGAGFSYLGRQVRLEVGGEEFFLDLLLYHVKLHCYVVVELKAGRFKPEYAGKLNFYIAAVDGEVKGEADQPTIGILICRSKNDTVVEYALRDVNNPIGVSEYSVTQSLPEAYRSVLPTASDMAKGLT